MTYKVYAEKLALSLLGVLFSMTSFSPLDSKKFSVFHLILIILCHSSVQSLSGVQLFVTRGLQHTRLPCPSPTPKACSNLCPSSRWCHPTISSSVVPFSFCLQSFPASGSFPISQLFTWGGQSYWSFSFSISPSNEYSGLISFRIDWLDVLAI